MKYFSILLALFLANVAHAQFSNAFLQNNSYWGDGKAEFNIYAAEIVREGTPHPCEVLHILMREAFDTKQLVRPNDPKQPTTIAVLKLNQILQIPLGLYLNQQMHSAFWRVDNAQLLKWSLTSADSFGNTFKEMRRTQAGFEYHFHTYFDGMAEGDETVPDGGHFYDELPWLVRTIDFSKPTNGFEIQLAPSAINSKKDSFEFQPAEISYSINTRTIEVAVQQAIGTDHFSLDRDEPHLLREWRTADGGHLKLKRNLKVDFWNYGKQGDRERALKNPMLRQPD